MRKGKRIRTVAPLLSPGSQKLGAELVRCAPGHEADAIGGLAGSIDAGTILLVGEWLAVSPGALDAVADLAGSSGVRIAWVPRRAFSLELLWGVSEKSSGLLFGRRQPYGGTTARMHPALLA